MKREITIEKLASTVVDREAVRRWLDILGVSEDYQLPENIDDPSLIVALAGKRCYNSFEVGLNPNVTKIRADWVQYLDNILASGHGSVCEHAVFTFGFEGVTRVFTAENNRHRAGCAISEASMRYIRFEEEIPYWEPTSIRGPDVFQNDSARVEVNDALSMGSFDDQGDPYTLDERKELSREIFRQAFELQEQYYRLLLDIWKPELAPSSAFAGKKQITSMMRRIVGLGCSTGEVWTGNIRAVRHVLTMRAAPEAEEEIAFVYCAVAKMMVESCQLFADFTQTDAGFWVPKYKKV